MNMPIGFATEKTVSVVKTEIIEYKINGDLQKLTKTVTDEKTTFKYTGKGEFTKEELKVLQQVINEALKEEE